MAGELPDLDLPAQVLRRLEHVRGLNPAVHLNLLGDIIQTRDGGFALTGTDSTDQGAYLLKLDAQGKKELT